MQLTTIPVTDELQAKMSKVYNILLALEDVASGECSVFGLDEIQKQQGYDITSKELAEFFNQYNIDIE